MTEIRFVTVSSSTPCWRYGNNLYLQVNLRACSVVASFFVQTLCCTTRSDKSRAGMYEGTTTFYRIYDHGNIEILTPHFHLYHTYEVPCLVWSQQTPTCSVQNKAKPSYANICGEARANLVEISPPTQHPLRPAKRPRYILVHTANFFSLKNCARISNLQRTNSVHVCVQNKMLSKRVMCTLVRGADNSC